MALQMTILVLRFRRVRAGEIAKSADWGKRGCRKNCLFVGENDKTNSADPCSGKLPIDTFWSPFYKLGCVCLGHVRVSVRFRRTRSYGALGCLGVLIVKAHPGDILPPP